MWAENSEGPRTYPSTIWSEVARAGRPEGDEAVRALESLLSRYYQPLLTHLMCRFQVSQEKAADLLHDFVHGKVLLGRLLSRASRTRGRFRNFLLSSLENFVRSELRREAAGKRMPAGGFCSFDEGEWEDASVELENGGASIETWAEALVQQTLERMREECERGGNRIRWGVFQFRVVEPMLNGGKPVGYSALVKDLKFNSPEEAANTLVAAKRMFKRILRQVVSEYAGEDGEAEEEIQLLRRQLDEKV